MLPPLTLSFLQALGYPRLDAALDLAAPEQLQSLIGWLENTKIRLYPAGGPERQGLTAAAADAFPPALCKYLEDLECPHPWDGGSNRDCVVHWLLAHAGEPRPACAPGSVPASAADARPFFSWACSGAGV
jgi:hypothetical protein